MTEQDHKLIRVLLFVTSMFVSLGFLILASRADSAELPYGMTCKHVVQVAGEHDVKNTEATRSKVRAIAASYGLTSAQIETIIKCLMRKQ